MTIQSTNPFITKGYTKNGVPFKKSNVAKAVFTVTTSTLAPKVLKTLSKDVFESTRSQKVVKTVATVGVLASIGFAIGSIVDGVINKVNAFKKDGATVASKEAPEDLYQLNAHQG